MKSIRIFLVVIFSLLAACSVHAAGIPDDVEQSIHFRVDNGYNVGIVVGIVKQGSVHYSGFGKKCLSCDEQTLDEKTVFEIGSFTKVFTSLLLADMAQRGQVALDDPIEKYLPDNVRAPKRNGKSITLAHLATHTSALPRVPDNMNLTDLTNPYADYSPEQMYEFLANHTLRRDIGAEYEYSNLGAGLLGHILELQAAISYEELIKKRITGVLGMPDTGITLTTDMKKRLAKGHRGGVEVPNWDFSALAGAGALRSTAEDMLTMLAANMGLKESNLYPAMKTTHQPRHEAGSAVMHIGLGWHILKAGDRQIFWHNGGTGSYWSFAGFDKAKKKGVVVLTNSMQNIDDLGFHLLDPNVPLTQLDPKPPLDKIRPPAEPVKVDLAPDEKLPTGNEIMDRFIKATGGRDALAKIKNRRINGTIEMKSLGLSGTMVMSKARPDKHHIKADFPGMMTTEQGTDGQILWELSSMTGPKIFKGKERATMLLHCRFDDLNYKKLYKKIECIGIEKIADEPCYKVIFCPNQLDPFTAYFSKATGLMARMNHTLPLESGQIKVESLMSGYRQIDGILYPYHVIESAMNITALYTAESIEHNVEMPEDRFEPPAEIKNLLEAERAEKKDAG